MNSLIQKTLLQPAKTTIQFKRFRGKINIQRPRAPHYERALFNAVTQPNIPKPTITELCYNNFLKPKIAPPLNIENPYSHIIAKEVLNWLNHSKFVAIFHLNSISAEEMFKVRVAFFKNNMHLKIYGKQIVQLAVANTKYETILPLVQAKNCIVFSADDQVTKLLQITKKTPQLILLAGIVENRLMSKNQLVEYSNLSDLTTVRAQFVAVLNSIGGGIHQQLQMHQNQLVSLLDAHASGLAKNDTTKADEDPSTVDKD